MESVVLLTMTAEDLRKIVTESVNTALAVWEPSAPTTSSASDEFMMGRQQAARQLGISLPTLDKALRSGAIRSNRIGRRVVIPKSAVNAYASQSGGTR